MATQIDSKAVVDPSAVIGNNCTIGPFCTVGPNVEVGDDTALQSHVVVGAHTRIGRDCNVFPFVTLGLPAQDLKYVPGTVTYTEIGDRNLIREFVSIHAGTEEGSKTVVGNDCALLAQSHIAHNCDVGNRVIVSHSASVGGHVKLGDHANISAMSAIHQFCHVGRAAMVAGMARVVQDVLPFTIAEGFPAHMRVINKVGMERAGYTAEQISEVRKVFRTLFMREMRLEEGVQQVRDAFGESENVKLMLDAIDGSQRGLARPDSATFEINVGD